MIVFAACFRAFRRAAPEGGNYADSGFLAGVLVCDEPVSALDITTRAQVLDLLSDLQRRLGSAMIFISHDLRIEQHLCHRIAFMKDGPYVETGTVEEIVEETKANYTKEQLLAALPQLLVT